MVFVSVYWWSYRTLVKQKLEVLNYKLHCIAFVTFFLQILCFWNDDMNCNAHNLRNFWVLSWWHEAENLFGIWQYRTTFHIYFFGHVHREHVMMPDSMMHLYLHVMLIVLFSICKNEILAACICPVWYGQENIQIS